MKIIDSGYMIAWDWADPPHVEVGPWPDLTGWSDAYNLTTGHCNAAFQQMSESQQAQALLNLAASLMFEGVSPQDILQEFSKIDVWRDMSVLLPQGRLARAFMPEKVNWNPHNPDAVD